MSHTIEPAKLKPGLTPRAMPFTAAHPMAVLPLVRLRVFFWHLAIGLIGAVIGGLAVARSAGRIGTGFA